MNKLKINKYILNSIYSYCNNTQYYCTNKQLRKKNMTCKFMLHVMGSGVPGTARGLFAYSRNSTTETILLFNCGEGASRLCAEYKHPIRKVEHIFLTRDSWENAGGIMGIGVYNPKDKPSPINLYGARGYFQFFKWLKPLLGRKIDYILHKINDIQHINIEDNLTVTGICLKSHEYNSSNNKNEAFEMCYIYICSPITKNDVKKSSNNGTSPILDGHYYSNSFIVIDIPSVKLLDPLISCPHFDHLVCDSQTKSSNAMDDILNVGVKEGKHNSELNFPSNPLNNDDASHPFNVKTNPCVIVHFTPPNITCDAKYQRWMCKFPQSSHLFINEESSCLGLKTVHSFQSQLNHICPTLFPRLTNISMQDNMISYLANLKCRQGKTFMAYHIIPRYGFDESQCPSSIIDLYSKTSSQHENEYLNNIHINKHETLKHPTITFTGTGSSLPIPTKNVSGIFITLSDCQSALFDCGEGTFLQLLQLHGLAGSIQVLQKLSVIFISHHHVDHHMGLVLLLLQRCIALQNEGLDNKKLYLICPASVYAYLKRFHYHFHSQILDNIQFLPNHVLCPYHSSFDEKTHDDICQAVGITSLHTARVKHCRHSYGIAMKVASNACKIAYSGDCVPTKEFVKVGENCDILIHEATYEDGVKMTLEKRQHSSFSDAINVAKQMNARHVLLTHFSQRYHFFPFVRKELPSNVGLAFDNMQVSHKDVNLVPKIFPVVNETIQKSISAISLKKK